MSFTISFVTCPLCTEVYSSFAEHCPFCETLHSDTETGTVSETEDTDDSFISVNDDCESIVYSDDEYTDP
jgi:hypothetical protein